MEMTLLSRREWIVGSAGFAALNLAPPQPRSAATPASGLVAIPPGGYLYVPGIDAFSLAAVAAEGFEVVRATFRRPPRFPDGLDDVARHLRTVKRPMSAVCGFELRSGRQATMPEFLAFNEVYVTRLRATGILPDEHMSVTRTNVVADGSGPGHSIHAFTYTMPIARQGRGAARTFMLSGIPPVRFQGAGVRPEPVGSDSSPEGRQQQAAFVLDAIEGLLTTIGAKWTDVTGIQLHTRDDIHPLLAELILPRIGTTGWHGIAWYYTQLPVAGGALEIAVRSTHMELAIST